MRAALLAEETRVATRRGQLQDGHQEVNALVCELYGLTEEEIAIVQGPAGGTR